MVEVAVGEDESIELSVGEECFGDDGGGPSLVAEAAAVDEGAGSRLRLDQRSEAVADREQPQPGGSRDGRRDEVR